MSHRYVVALGSNMRVPGVGSPKRVIEAALDTLSDSTIRMERASRIIASLPVGPSQRRYVNAAALVESDHAPPDMLDALQELENRFGRRRRGVRWRARPLDLDIVLWSGGLWSSDRLAIPHPAFRERPFVLGPASQVAPHWRDPVSGFTLRQLAARVS